MMACIHLLLDVAFASQAEEEALQLIQNLKARGSLDLGSSGGQRPPTVSAETTAPAVPLATISMRLASCRRPSRGSFWYRVALQSRSRTDAWGTYL